MKSEKSAFALFFGNRGFFPAGLMADARKEMSRRLHQLGNKTLMLDADATRHGAVETPAEGRRYAQFLCDHRDEVDGVILSLPNFGDENGAVAALKDAGVPILVQAYPDELDKMAPDQRRDAFCGKMSIMDVFYQHDIPFTALQPHTVHPASDAFAANVDLFDRTCRVVGGMSDLVVGAIGARTSPFKTVRFDEVALQRGGITVETFDLSDVFARMGALKAADAKLKAKAAALRRYADWQGVPKQALDQLARLGVVLDRLIEEAGLDAIAVRCWTEMQMQLGISPCVVMGMLNDAGVAAACEVDVGNAIAMTALRLASGRPAACLDWNNNYGDELDKCILFHCGPVPASLMAGKGRISDHAILANAVGPGCGYGCNTGRIAAGPFTFGSLLTENGGLEFYLGRGEFTDDPIPADFFGCAGVARIPQLQDVLQTIGYLGHRHHTSITPGDAIAPLREAFGRYLGYGLTLV